MCTLDKEDRYDIFCDASVGPDLIGSCAGALVMKNCKESGFNYVIQPKGTNNTGELGAILLGVMAAGDIKMYYQLHGLHQPRINIFSDSLISVKALREWLFTWVSKSKGNCLIKGDGKEAMNQGYIKQIVNITNYLDLRYHIYHQNGHVGHAFHKVSPAFYTDNNITLESIGLTPEFIAICNDTVDVKTREIINDFLGMGMGPPIISPHVEYERDKAYDNHTLGIITFGTMEETMEQYKRRIFYNDYLKSK